MSSSATFPVFRPHRLLLGGDLQTLAGVYWPMGRYPYTAQRHEVALDDGDRLIVHDDRPEPWAGGDRVALLMHGLAGSHMSGYMVRCAAKLAARGVRVFRLDLRGCGAGFGLAQWPYHSGRSEDAAAVLRFLAHLCPDSPVSIVGFSLSGNIVLKLCGELGETRCGGLTDCLAVCPPIDLMACSRRLAARRNRPYDRHFVSMLLSQLREQHAHHGNGPGPICTHHPRTLYEFDDSFTAPVCGFGDAANYYALASAAPKLRDIRVPTRIIAASNDPMIPADVFRDTIVSTSVDVRIAASGGHLGFIGRRSHDADNRWIDWRVVDWVTAEHR